jgi:2-keto-4-pentenoate hydratase/2-oxohepta-3-ene-1,7-dioic acid hydratase in catechol pathway
MMDDLVLAGFYFDNFVIPIDQAAETYCEEVSVQLLLTATNNLLELLPPDGRSYDRLLDLAYWLDDLDADDRAEFSIPVEDVQLLVPIARPNKVLLVSENYAAQPLERSVLAARRAEESLCVFMKPPTTSLTNPFGPVVLPSE